MANFIDRWIDRLEGNNWVKVTREECLRRVAAGIQVAFQEGQEGKLLFAGTAAPQEVERVAKEVEALLPDRRAIEQEIAAFKDMEKEILGFVLVQG